MSERIRLIVSEISPYRVFDSSPYRVSDVYEMRACLPNVGLG